MKLEYVGKKTKESIITDTKSVRDLIIPYQESGIDMLIYGDNLRVIKTLIEKKIKINLVYIDPPFSTNTVFKFGKNRTSTISASKSNEVAYNDTMIGPEYIEYIRERLILTRELMADTGSIYLHIDYKIGHYIKVVMDEVFGKQNFRNDISRIKSNPKNFLRMAYGNVKDMILFYTKSSSYVWNEPSVAYSKNDLARLFSKTDARGRSYTTTPLHAPGETINGATGKIWHGIKPPQGRHWRYNPDVLEKLNKEGLIEWSKNNVPRKKIYADEFEKKGMKMQDIWEYKDPQNPLYPTQKNIKMLKTIINTSSNPSDVVFDCFAGSGTTLIAAKELNRHWIGIDNSHRALEVAYKRLETIKQLQLV